MQWAEGTFLLIVLVWTGSYPSTCKTLQVLGATTAGIASCGQPSEKGTAQLSRTLAADPLALAMDPALHGDAIRALRLGLTFTEQSRSTILSAGTAPALSPPTSHPTRAAAPRTRPPTAPSNGKPNTFAGSQGRVPSRSRRP